MLDLGLNATVNSDDPAYMLGYDINENFDIAQREAGYPWRR
jgi:adenosine deaminase